MPLPVLRITIPKPGSSFQPGDPDPVSVLDFFVTTKQLTDNPFIAAREDGSPDITFDGQKLTELSGKVQDGEIVVKVIDGIGDLGAQPGMTRYYLRDIANALDLSTMAARTPFSVPTAMPPMAGGQTWQPLEVTKEHVGGGGEVAITPMTDVLTLSQTKKATPGSGARHHSKRPTGGPSGQFNFRDVVGRFSTDPLAAQIVQPFTAVFHHHGNIGTAVDGLAAWQGVLVHWRPGVGVISEYRALTVPYVDATAVGNGVGESESFTSLSIVVTAPMSIQAGDTVVLEVQSVQYNDSIPTFKPSFIYDGVNETAPGVGSDFDYASWIDLPQLEPLAGPPSVLGTGRYMTGSLYDLYARQELLQRKSFFEISLDDGATYPILLAVKYLLSAKMEQELVWELKFGDTRRVERVSKAWRNFSPFDNPVLQHFTNVHGGVYKGFTPLAPDLGLRTYSVDATFTDPEGIEFPAVRLIQTGGPVTDTYSQVGQRTQDLYTEKVWPYSDTRIVGAYPELGWYLLDPTTEIVLHGPLLPMGLQLNLSQQQRDTQPMRYHMLRWMDHTTPITGPYKAICVSLEPSDEFPIFIKAHPVDVITALFELRNIEYDATTAAAIKDAIGPHVLWLSPIRDPEESIQDVLDRFSLMFRFLVRRSRLESVNEFVHWFHKLDAAPALTLDIDDVLRGGGPGFDISEDSYVNRVGFEADILTAWDGSYKTATVKEPRTFLGIPYGTRSRTIRVPSNDKPASGIVINRATETIDHATVNPLTPDADIYGEKAISVAFGGMPAWNGGQAMNFRQYVECLARHLFDRHGRGAGYTGHDFSYTSGAENVQIGDAVVLDLPHVPNAQLGRFPTAQRGGPRPWRCIQATDNLIGFRRLFVDEDSGDRYTTIPFFVMRKDPNDPLRSYILELDKQTFDFDKCQIEFEARVYLPTDTLPTSLSASDAGTPFWTDDASLWTADPQPVRVGPFTAGSTVYIRARAWKFGHAPSDWSGWTGIGGVISPPTTPSTSISQLSITNITGEGADLTWSYDETPPVGSVKIQYRQTTPLVGPWTTFSTLAPGSESETIDGLLGVPGETFEVRVVLIDGSSVEYGNVLTGSFILLGTGIDTLTVSSVTELDAKLAWNSGDGINRVLIERHPTVAGPFVTVVTLPAGSNRYRIPLPTPGTSWDVRVSLIDASGVNLGDGRGGPGLTRTITTLPQALPSIQLASPHSGIGFSGVDATGLSTPGAFGARFFSDASNPSPHEVIFLVAVETAIGSGIPGAFVERDPSSVVVSGNSVVFSDVAPLDGLKRYIQTVSRLSGYVDSDASLTIVLDPEITDPLPPEGPPGPPSGGSGAILAWLEGVGWVPAQYVFESGGNMIQGSSGEFIIHRDS